MKGNTTIKILNISITLKSFLVPLWDSSLWHPSISVIHPRAPTGLLFVSIDEFASLSRFSYKWNHIVLLFLCLASEFTLVIVYMNTSFILLLMCIPLYGSSEVCLSTRQLMDVCFQFLAILMEVTMDICTQVFVGMCFHFSG